MDVIGPIALLMAIVCGIAAGYMLWMGQNANRTGRGALFHTERQVAIDRAGGDLAHGGIHGGVVVGG